MQMRRPPHPMGPGGSGHPTNPFGGRLDGHAEARRVGHETGGYRQISAENAAQPSLGDLGPLLRGGRPDPGLGPRDDDALEQPGR